MVLPAARDPQALDRRVRTLIDHTLPEDDGPGLARLARLLIALVRLQPLLLQVPVVEARLGPGPDADLVRAGLRRHSGVRRNLVHGVTAVIEIPSDPAEYASGGSRRTLRKHVSRAERDAIRVRSVPRLDERAALVTQGDAFERSHPHARYRFEHADNTALAADGQWFVAVCEDDRPVVLANLVVADQWGLVRYLRIIDPHETASDARYLMMLELIRAAASLGARYVITDTGPVRLNAGLRVFQHRVGFEYRRVRLRGASARSLRADRSVRLEELRDR